MNVLRSEGQFIPPAHSLLAPFSAVGCGGRPNFFSERDCRNVPDLERVKSNFVTGFKKERNEVKKRGAKKEREEKKKEIYSNLLLREGFFFPHVRLRSFQIRFWLIRRSLHLSLKGGH